MEKWSPATIREFRRTLLAWYDQEGRDLPWRHDHDPYHVWVSEIMLQQTQVQTVIPYYQCFMAAFPTVTALANAAEADLLKAWQGLGYYSRARNLQRAARQLVTDYHGQWPTTAATLQNLVGVGPYTACAIASIAFNEVVPAIDGNAFRVFARLLLIDADVAQPKTRQVFFDILQPIVDSQRPGDFNQAVMDLGSSYMTAKTPDPAHSPVRAFDASYRTDQVLAYPVKTKKPRPKLVPYYGLLVTSPAGDLLVQRSAQQMLAGYWTYPLIPKADLLPAEATTTPTLAADIAALEARWQRDYQLSVRFTPLGGRTVSQTYTHQRWQVSLLQAKLPTATPLTYFPGQWVATTQVADLPAPKVQEKMMRRWAQARAAVQ